MKLKTSIRNLAFPLIITALAPASLSAATIFSDDFSGGTGDINGETPDERPGTETWTATNVFNADGSFGGNPGSATLTFSPEQGKVYTLQTSLAFNRSGSGDWLGIGFAKGQDTFAGTSNRFLGPDTIGRAWMYFRSNTNNPSAAMNGVDDGATWTTLFPETTTGNPVALDMRVVLDTTGGAGNWTATWFAKNTADSTYITVRATTDLLTEDIDSVGYALSGTGISGNVDNFSLTVVPEPSAALLGAIGALCLLRRRR